MKAEIYSITPFDAQIGTTIRYNWRSTQTAVKVTIKRGNQIVYQETTETSVRQVVIPGQSRSGLSNSLQNQYVVYIDIKDANGTWSETSDGMTFMCLSTPTLSFTNLPSADTNGTYIIEAYFYTFNVEYNQTDGERLAQWQVTLYSADGDVLSTSGLQSSTNRNGTKETFSYPFSGFSDKKQYRIKAEGKTVHGISVSTDYIGINSDYSTSSVFALLNATNKPDEGKIHIGSNIVSIVCKVYGPDGKEVPEDKLGNHGLLYKSDYTQPSDNQTINGNHALILKPGYKMVIDEGFKIGGNYSASLIFINPIPNAELFTIGQTKLYYRVGKFTSDWSNSQTGQQACFELVVSGVVNVVYISNIIDRPATNERVGVVVVRDGDRYSLIASNNFRLSGSNQTPIESYARSQNGSVG